MRQTKTDLLTVKGVTGQTGYVVASADSNDNGLYIYDGDAWTRPAPRILAGEQYKATTDANSMIKISFPSTITTTPTAVIITQGRYNGLDDAAKYFTPKLWHTDLTGFTVRGYDERSNAWSDKQIFSFNWVAIWL